MLIFGILLLVVALFLALIAYSRTLSHDVAEWHVDPLTAPKPSTPNSYRVGPAGTESADDVAPMFSQDAAAVGAAFAAVISEQNSVEIIAGSEAEGWVTYVQRSTLFGFPDYISVRFIDLDSADPSGGGSTLAVFSRSRLGQSDLGVNEKRVNAWISALQSALA